MSFSKFLLFLVFLFSFVSCDSEFPNRNPVGKKFPEVSGNTLEQRSVKIPALMKGKASILLVGYKQDSQFDIDRWMIGFDMKKFKIEMYEVPTIASFWAGLFQSKIDQGMRNGIPQKNWKIVITVYEDGEKIEKFLGNQKPNNARVLLLDEKGEVIWFYDQGFSVQALNSLEDALKE